jgi:hypothetical protein
MPNNHATPRIQGKRRRGKQETAGNTKNQRKRNG